MNGRISRLAYQPREGPRWQSQDKNAGHLSDAPTKEKNICLLHGPGHTSEECKVLKISSKKYAAQRPHQN